MLKNNPIQIIVTRQNTTPWWICYRYPKLSVQLVGVLSQLEDGRLAVWNRFHDETYLLEEHAVLIGAAYTANSSSHDVKFDAWVLRCVETKDSCSSQTVTEKDEVRVCTQDGACYPTEQHTFK